MKPSENLLPLLERVKRTGHGRWVARCPAHDDKTPSLCVTEKDDDRLLIRCWAGCNSADVLAAVRLDLADLYPQKLGTPGAGYGPVRRPFNAGQLIETAAKEAGVCAIILGDVLSGVDVSVKDIQRGIAAAHELADIAETVRG